MTALTLLVALVAAAVANPAPPGGASDAEIKQKIIQESIDSYPGNCPCPYSTDRAGRRCGARSAHDRAGGYAPRCFAPEVSAAEVAAYRRSH